MHVSGYSRLMSVARGRTDEEYGIRPCRVRAAGALTGSVTWALHPVAGCGPAGCGQPGQHCGRDLACRGVRGGQGSGQHRAVAAALAVDRCAWTWLASGAVVANRDLAGQVRVFVQPFHGQVFTHAPQPGSALGLPPTRRATLRRSGFGPAPILRPPHDPGPVLHVAHRHLRHWITGILTYRDRLTLADRGDRIPERCRPDRRGRSGRVIFCRAAVIVAVAWAR